HMTPHAHLTIGLKRPCFQERPLAQYLAAVDNPYFIAYAVFFERLMYEDQGRLQRYTHRVGKFQRSRTRTSLRSVYGYEVGINFQLLHHFAQLNKFVGSADTQFEPYRLPVR